MFTPEQERAIAEKISQLEKIKNGTLTLEDLALSITLRRMRWLGSNFSTVFAKYKELRLEELAYRAIYLDHMKINPDHSEMIRLSPTRIRINSYNFCPYLIACQKLDLDTRFVCKNIVEPGIQAVCEAIHPNLRFSRNYDNIRNIRSKTPEVCEEYIELRIR